MPDGCQEFSSAIQVQSCVFCGRREPSDEHLRTRHGTAACLQKPLPSRSFSRKDGLVQHIKGSHSDSLLRHPNKIATGWERKGDVNEGVRIWECGFCGEYQIDWHDRCKYIESHFKDGMNMLVWFERD